MTVPLSVSFRWSLHMLAWTCPELFYSWQFVLLNPLVLVFLTSSCCLDSLFCFHLLWQRAPPKESSLWITCSSDLTKALAHHREGESLSLLEVACLSLEFLFQEESRTVWLPESMTFSLRVLPLSQMVAPPVLLPLNCWLCWLPWVDFALAAIFALAIPTDCMVLAHNTRGLDRCSEV